MKERQEDNLVSTWLIQELSERPTRTLSDVVDEMNVALTRNYRISRIAEWERGSRHPDPVAHNYMLSRALPYAVQSACSNNKQLCDVIPELLEKISIPVPARRQ
ncbi:MAG: hypothetical protein AAF662_02755 [Pseudomonadota bacterium]